MSALTDYFPVIRTWIDDVNPSDDVLTQGVRLAEERINNELRSLEQVTRGSATFDDNCAPYPDDWLEVIYVRLLDQGNIFRYITPDAYWQFNAQPQVRLQQPDPTGAAPWPAPGSQQVYTNIGRTLFVLPRIDPDLLTKIEVGYFRKIAPLGETMDPVMQRYPSILLNCTLAAIAPYLVEDERLNTFAALATAGIAKANDQAAAGRWGGSPMVPVVKGFG